ncbi:hypothetical protein P2Q00_33300 [Streptomyces coacervatus]|uniref:hypothetical protein n=1 Tax=Streptomyces coacervatus TaxID=647381 RepID=UPI0023DB2870|nr:hypothetical protein [Streptomyces coacervatus]MDF2270269.1 hypothetical protein [Streptomyces coacervatus]
MSDEIPRRPGWTKDKAGAAFAAWAVFFLANPAALEWTSRAFPDWAHRLATIISIALAVPAYWMGLRFMKRLP